MSEQKYDEEELWKRVVPKKEKTFLDYPIPSHEMKFLNLIRELVEVSLEHRTYNQRALEEKDETIEERLKNLEREVRNIKKHMITIQEPPKSDIIYEKFRKKLEQEHYGKIVAIDIKSGTIAGIGNTILEAYEEARKKSGKTRFAYRKVGYPFICKLR